MENSRQPIANGSISLRTKEVFLIALFEDSPDNPPSHDETELPIPSTPLTLHAYRDLLLTPL